MKNKKILFGIIFTLVFVIAIVGMMLRNERHEKKSEKVPAKMEEKITGIYLTYGEEDEFYVFVDPKNETLFLAELPEDEIFDSKGQEISKDDLEAGDTMELYGTGAMTQSIPPQYGGVKKAILTEKGSEKIADQYQPLIDEIYQAPDPDEIPTLSIENSQSNGIVMTSINPYKYEWSYTDETGKESKKISEDNLLNAEVPEIVFDSKDKSLNLYFSRKPKSITVKRYHAGSSISEEENLEFDGAEIKLENAQNHSTYEIEALWENGFVQYQFKIVD